MSPPRPCRAALPALLLPLLACTPDGTGEPEAARTAPADTFPRVSAQSAVPLDTMLGFRLGQSEEEVLSLPSVRRDALECEMTEYIPEVPIKFCQTSRLSQHEPGHYRLGFHRGTLVIVSRSVEPGWSGLPVDSLVRARSRVRGAPEHTRVFAGHFDARWYGRDYTAVLDLTCREATVANGCRESIETSSLEDAQGHWSAHHGPLSRR